jgi:hypothetical protein
VAAKEAERVVEKEAAKGVVKGPGVAEEKVEVRVCLPLKIGHTFRRSLWLHVSDAECCCHTQLRGTVGHPGSDKLHCPLSGVADGVVVGWACLLVTQPRESWMWLHV